VRYEAPLKIGKEDGRLIPFEREINLYAVRRRTRVLRPRPVFLTDGDENLHVLEVADAIDDLRPRRSTWSDIQPHQGAHTSSRMSAQGEHNVLRVTQVLQFGDLESPMSGRRVEEIAAGECRLALPRGTADHDDVRSLEPGPDCGDLCFSRHVHVGDYMVESR
jgi:hypothetical protein